MKFRVQVEKISSMVYEFDYDPEPWQGFVEIEEMVVDRMYDGQISDDALYVTSINYRGVEVEAVK